MNTSVMLIQESVYVFLVSHYDASKVSA